MYAIKMKKDLYGVNGKWEIVNELGNFESKELANEKIEELNAIVYYLGHNESGRPEYKAFKI